MIRVRSLVLGAMLGASLLACGSNGTSATDPLNLVPVDNTVSGWTVDQHFNKSPGQRAMVATTETGVGAFIDGGSENYFQDANAIPKKFLWQNYVNSTLPAAPDGATVELYIFEMESADKAKELFTGILSRPKWQSTNGWQTPSPPVGTLSRIEDNGGQWWVNFQQDVFYVEVQMEPSYGPPPDYAVGNADTKAEAVRFAQAVAKKI